MCTSYKNPAPFDWTPNRDAILRSMRADGATRAEIGDTLGTTERVIKDRVSRLGIAAPVCTWTDERIALLKKLWSEGLSASQIAKWVGGATKNAVIGKIHRLGLPARQTTSRSARKPPVTRVTLPAKPCAPRSPIIVQLRAAMHSRASMAVAVPLAEPIALPEIPNMEPRMKEPAAPVFSEAKPAFSEPEPVAPRLRTVPAVEEEPAPRLFGVQLLDLKEHSCRWPVGDPRNDGFHFCGQRRADGSPYCSQHTRVAYQPVSRRREPVAQKIAS